MKATRFLIAVLVFSGILLGAYAKESPLGLEDCYKLALKRSELIAINAEDIKIAEAHFLQSFGAILPQVSFSREDNRQGWETSTVSRKGFEDGFVFKQAIFSGFKEFAAMAQSRLEKKQREKEKLRARQLLFADVSDAFYFLLELRQNLMILEATKKALSDRVKELQVRANLGKSRMSEIAGTKVQLYTVQDEVEAARNQELLARELLAFLIGRPVDKLAEEKFEPVLKTQEEYLSGAQSRLDVEAAELAWQQDKKQTTIAQSGFLPTISLSAEYHRHSSTVSSSEGKWSGALTIDIPIMEGTTVLGQVKEALAHARQSRLTFERSQRLAVQEARDAYVNMRIDIVRRGILEKALKSAVLNYNLQIEDYKHNVVNNLDVLTAIQALGDARRNYVHVAYEAKRFYRQLLAASGEMNAQE